MDFESAKKVAQKWVTSSQTQFDLIDTDSSAKRFVFGSTTGNETFYVVGPNHDSGAISWHVWSDNDEVLGKLHHVIDSLQSCKEKTLTEVLNSVNRALAVTQGAAAMASIADDEIEEDLDDDEDEYDDAYYEDDDPDASEDTECRMPKGDSADDVLYARQGNPTAVKRLLKDWKNMKGAEKFSVCAAPRSDNLFVWDVKLKDFPKESQLAKDLQEYSKKYRREPVVFMEMIFPEEYPMAPPFVRILRPRFAFLTGHVTLGGSICMELLTKSGWRPTNDIENILVQIRSEIISDKKATLDKQNTDVPYDKLEAQRAFQRMVQRYGWDK